MYAPLCAHRTGLRLARILLALGLDRLGPSHQLVEGRFLDLEVVLEFRQLGFVGRREAVLAHHVGLLFAVYLDINDNSLLIRHHPLFRVIKSHQFVHM